MRAFIAIAVVALASGGGYYGYRWWTEGRFFISTDDAYVSADITQIAAKVAGHIASIEVAENHAVKAGDLLARIDDGDYRLAVRAARERLDSQRATITRIARQQEAAQSAVAQASAQLDAVRATQAKAQADYKRQSELTSVRVGSVSQLDAARAERDNAIASVRAAEAGVAQAQANVAVAASQKVEAETVVAELKTTLAKAERDLSFTEIRAPVDGIVGSRAVEIGSYVQPGTRVMPLIATGRTEIDANFKETQIAALKPGARVQVTADAYDGRVLEGRVASLSPATGSVFSLLPPDNATGNFTKVVQRVPVKIDVQDPDGLLRVGLSVVVSVDSRSGRR